MSEGWSELTDYILSDEEEEEHHNSIYGMREHRYNPITKNYEQISDDYYLNRIHSEKLRESLKTSKPFDIKKVTVDS